MYCQLVDWVSFHSIFEICIEHLVQENGDSSTDLNNESNRKKVTIKKNTLKFIGELTVILPHSFNLIVLKN